MFHTHTHTHLALGKMNWYNLDNTLIKTYARTSTLANVYYANSVFYKVKFVFNQHSARFTHSCFTYNIAVFKCVLVLSAQTIVHKPTGVPMHPPWSSMSGIIFFSGLPGMIFAMLPKKSWDWLPFSAIFQNGRQLKMKIPISWSVELLETWFWSLYPYFKGQGIQWEQ